MMVELLAASGALSIIGALFSLLLVRWDSAAKYVGCACGVLAALASLASGLLAIVSEPFLLTAPTVFWFADFTLLWNPLAGLIVVVISLLSVAAWIYGFSYFEEYRGQGIGQIGFYMHLFIISMLLVVLSDNAFWFLVLFELMSLTSYFLVVFDQTKQSIRGGFMYFVMAHVGFMMIMVAFFVMAWASGSFEFSAFRALELPIGMASVVFVLAFVGFGIKAGMLPFHSWLPQAHPAAPSNVSALMSGGMIKIGIFGIVKVAFDLLGGSDCQLWWGLAVLVVGVVSSVLGIAYALMEHDVKKLLAFSSVENIGIILIGIGVALVGCATGNLLVASIGLMAGLYHTLNHAMFKGALFLGAGSMIYRTHTRNIDQMGGLSKYMPATAITFLIAAISVCAIPPLNGFASEWFTYQSLLTAALQGDGVVMGFMAFAAAALAITGALAVICFIKCYGVAFAGKPRVNLPDELREAPTSMVFGTALLALMCIVLGLGVAFVAPFMQDIASATLGISAVTVASGAVVSIPGSDTAISLLVVAVVLLVLTLLLRGILGIFNSQHGAGVRDDAWACGYLPDLSMPPSSGTFATNVRGFFGPMYDARDAVVERKSLVMRAYEGLVSFLKKLEPMADKYLVDGVTSFAKRIGVASRGVEGGDYRRYIGYIVIVLAISLILTVAVG